MKNVEEVEKVERLKRRAGDKETRSPALRGKLRDEVPRIGRGCGGEGAMRRGEDKL